jgi:hypothetical protein
MFPPSDTPKIAARSDPTASRTVRMSSIRCSSVGRALSDTRSDNPVPRLSKMIRREKEASRSRKRASGGISHPYSTLETQPCTNTRSKGASPTT